jgi:hypothetical protein
VSGQFEAHSLGGIIVKEALRRSFGHRDFQREYHRIYELTAGLIFFGTSHRGADPHSIFKMVAEQSLHLASFQVNEQLTLGLLPTSERLKELRDEFSKMVRLHDWRVHTFQEAYGMRRLMGAKVGGTSTPTSLVQSLTMNLGCRGHFILFR